METIGAYQVKTHLGSLLRRVAEGESFTITKNGVPVAKLVPIEERSKPDVEQVIAEIRAFRKERPLGGLSVSEIKALIEEGRRF